MMKTMRIVFQTLKRFKLVRTHRSFSVDYLGRGSRYFDGLVCARKQASIAATVLCLGRVERLAEMHEASGSTVAATELRRVVELLWSDLQERNVIKLHPRRPKMPKFERE